MSEEAAPVSVDSLFRGQVALVTGAAKRTGREIALCLARGGADVAIHYRSSASEAASVVEEIRALGRRGLAVRAELADAEEAAAAVGEVLRAWGRVDILVNNVGAIVWKDLDELSPAEWQQGLDGTVTATFHMCRAALPAMREQGYGRIVNILDADADLFSPVPHATAYKIGKAATWLLTKTLAANEAGHGITVNAVSPGTLENSEKQPPMSRVPLGRPGRPSEVADAVAYFARRSSEYITGANLKVSGGYLI